MVNVLFNERMYVRARCHQMHPHIQSFFQIHVESAQVKKGLSLGHFDKKIQIAFFSLPARAKDPKTPAWTTSWCLSMGTTVVMIRCGIMICPRKKGIKEVP